jgi:hypothetical protein
MPKHLFDDLQFRRKTTPDEFLFLSAECVRVDNIVFNVQHVRWDAEALENRTIAEEHIDAVDFSAWWLRTLQAGWAANWRRA